MAQRGGSRFIQKASRNILIWAIFCVAAGAAGAAPATIYPRVISPNGDGINDFVFFVVENRTAAPSSGSIYNSQMLKVADVRESAVFIANNTVLAWDGKDESGSVVNAGIYIYKIQVGNDAFTGTVGVAR